MVTSGKTSRQRLMADYAALASQLESHFDGQVRLDVNNEDNMDFLYFMLKPRSGPYRGGRFYFTMRTDNYPDACPLVICETKIYHPNIDSERAADDYSETNVCVSLLEEDWSQHSTLVDVIQAVLYLFYQPNLEDALSPYFTGLGEDDFEEKVRISLQGGTIDDWIEFPRNLDESYELEFLEGNFEEEYKYRDPEDADEEEDRKAHDVSIEDWESKDIEEDVKKNEVMTRTKNDVNAKNVEKKTDDVTKGDVVLEAVDVVRTDVSDQQAVELGDICMNDEYLNVGTDLADVIELGETFMNDESGITTENEDTESRQDSEDNGDTNVDNNVENRVAKAKCNFFREFVVDWLFFRLWTRVLQTFLRQNVAGYS